MAKKVSEPYTEYIRMKKGVLQTHSAEEKVKLSSLRGKLIKQSDEEIKNKSKNSGKNGNEIFD